jgi:hypothetical protein
MTHSGSNEEFGVLDERIRAELDQAAGTYVSLADLRARLEAILGSRQTKDDEGEAVEEW